MSINRTVLGKVLLFLIYRMQRAFNGNILRNLRSYAGIKISQQILPKIQVVACSGCILRHRFGDFQTISALLIRNSFDTIATVIDDYKEGNVQDELVRWELIR